MTAEPIYTVAHTRASTHSIPGHLTASEVAAHLRSDAERQRAHADKLIASLDADELKVCWTQGMRPILGPGAIE